MNPLIFACSAGNPELIIYPAILVGVFLFLPILIAGLMVVGGVVFKLGKAMEEMGEIQRVDGPPPLRSDVSSV